MYLTPKQDRILSYLAQGLKPSQVASLVGVTPAYLSQLAKDEEFKGALLERIEATSKEDPAIEEHMDLKYKALESTLLDKIAEAAQFAESKDLARIFEVVTNRQDKRQAKLIPQTQQTNIAIIQLPAHAAPAALTYQMNEQQQITSIGHRLMAPLSAEGVRNVFAQMGSEATQAPKEFPRLEYPVQELPDDL